MITDINMYLSVFLVVVKGLSKKESYAKISERQKNEYSLNPLKLKSCISDINETKTNIQNCLLKNNKHMFHIFI